MSSLFSALSFLTVIPIIGTKSEVKKESIGHSTAYFPLVGALQGGIAAGAAYLLSFVMIWELAALFAIILIILTNGAFHIDGLADTVDGLAGGKTREERLNIMKDPHTGAIGVTAIVIVLLIKYITLKELAGELRYPILFLMPVFGRWSMVPMAYWGDYARKNNGLGKVFTDHTGTLELVIATIITALLSWILTGMEGILCLTLIIILAYLWTLFFKKRLGGITGDVFGFQSEVSEVIFLIMMIIQGG